MTTSHSDVRAVLEERGTRYGEFDNHAAITQGMKNYLRVGPSWNRMTPAQKEAAEMIVHKLGRVVNGDPNYLDTWTDIAGYAMLVEQSICKNAPDTTQPK